MLLPIPICRFPLPLTIKNIDAKQIQIQLKNQAENVKTEIVITGFILKISGEADGSIELEKSYIQLEKILHST